jgi:hypothetical protein
VPTGALAVEFRIRYSLKQKSGEVSLGSLRFDGIRFTVYSKDHPPPHVHGFYAGVEVVVEFVDQKAVLSSREKAVVPSTAKRSDIKKILTAAAENAELLLSLWEQIHE